MNKGLFAAALCGLLVACGGGGGGGTGKISMGVTDAPVEDAKAVVVKFTAVELLGADGETRERITLNPAQSIDLYALHGENQALLFTDVVVDAGEYREIRLLTDVPNASGNACTQASSVEPESYVQTLDGVKHPLLVPSGASSGFKVKGPIIVAVDGSVSYTVDFDLRKSLAARNDDCYNLRPVLRVVDTSSVGTLTGSVDLASAPSCGGDTPVDTSAVLADGKVPGVAVYVFANPDGTAVVPDDIDNNLPEPLTTASVYKRVDGNANVSFDYTVGFLPAASYTVALTCDAGADVAPTVLVPSEEGYLASGDDSAVVAFDYTSQVTVTAATAETDPPTVLDLEPIAP